MSELYAYFRGNSFHVRDLDGHHWTVRQGRATGKGTRIPSDGSRIDPAEEHAKREGALSLKNEVVPRKTGSGTHGRFGTSSGWVPPWIRGPAHGIANVLLQEGSWAWYTGWGDVKRPPAKEVKHGYRPKRGHKAAMDAATLKECGQALSATQYARLRSSGLSITSGHAYIAYEWCHLVAHGMGGSDSPDNIVAATAFQNTEQLILECVLYGYRMEGLEVEVQAKLARGWEHLGESIWYRVKLDDQTIYTRTMDCRRATRPDFKEYGAVAREMRRYINTALEKAYPADQMRMDAWELVQSQSPDEVDESAGLWQSLTGG
ncbi:hypothetical protein FAZ69_27840 [Trinickia terrae]|uniref:Uncharacterized protein n=1 Tax=Trinickia terrae TaxID=2571161 RepID=A0A4U1HPP7_9BURK|nr:hypothetical protein [Trinickia terrae]TKC81444.1 hypothetical protein FAZ69_27840 [Trinickia terrae]